MQAYQSHICADRLANWRQSILERIGLENTIKHSALLGYTEVDAVTKMMKDHANSDSFNVQEPQLPDNVILVIFAFANKLQP